MSVGEEESGAEDGGRVRRRRRWSEGKKRQIVAETYEPRVSVAVVAQRYDVNVNQVFKWRQLLREPAGSCRWSWRRHQTAAWARRRWAQRPRLSWPGAAGDGALEFGLRESSYADIPVVLCVTRRPLHGKRFP